MEPEPVDNNVPARSPVRPGLPKRLKATHEAQDDVPTFAAARTQPDRQERALDLARRCARIAADNRAKDVLVLDLRQATPLVDYFVIATAAARRQAQAMVYEIDAEMKRVGEEKLGIEGAEEGRWALIDYGDFVVHVFDGDSRAYYALEDVWGDAPRIEWQ